MEEFSFAGMELPDIITYACDLTSSTNDVREKPQLSNKSNESTDHEERIERFREVMTPKDDYDDVFGSDKIFGTIAKSFAQKIEGLKEQAVNPKPSSKVIGINGFLLYGLSGVGKTSLLKMVAVRLAKQLKTNISFINVNSANMLDKYVGETQKLIDTLYRVADKFSPTLICVDEIDGFCAKRKDNEDQHVRSFKTQFLASMSGLVSHPYVITAGSTNKPWDLDVALLRRFEMKYYIQLPTPNERMQILENAIQRATKKAVNEHALLRLDSPEILKYTEGFTGADLLAAVIKAVNRITFVVYQGDILSDTEHQARKKEIEENEAPITYTIGFLSNDILLQRGLKCVSPTTRDMDEMERLDEFARENPDAVEDSTNQVELISNHQGTETCGFDIFCLLCCCLRC